MGITGAYVFLVGSERSGTTVLGQILDRHPDIAQWYEPYFVWDKYFRLAPHDARSAGDATPRVISQVFNDFERYRKKQNKPVIFDKSPRNSLKIPFILKIFPNARFVHMLRDGRDATLSINKEWHRRAAIIGKPGGTQKFDYIEALKVIRAWLKRQPFLKDRLRAFWFETHGHLLDKKKNLNRLRWHGEIGWGPRFKGWEKAFDECSRLEFNALQWAHCVSAVRDNWALIPDENKVEIRYEQFISEPRRILTDLFDRMDVSPPQSFFSSIPQLKKTNFNKWQREFTSAQIDQIKPILNPLLDRLGYTEETPW